MKITVLGSGTSHGVPPIDCVIDNYAHCPKGVCAASLTDARHRRTRCSIFIQHQQQHLLVDVSADFRQQMLREKVSSIHAVLLTHSHADHIGGTPDIRSYTRNAPLPFYGTPETLDRLRESYGYIFNPPAMRGGGIPEISLVSIDGPFVAAGMQVTPLPVQHGSCAQAVGYRINDMAYIPDAKTVPPETLRRMAGVRLLVIDALRTQRPHSTHLILPESIALAREIGAAQTYFTHLCHDIHYVLDKALLDPNMDFAWDGMQIEI